LISGRFAKFPASVAAARDRLSSCSSSQGNVRVIGITTIHVELE
jgi:hypothetical protein